jgi:hypothetical protein
MQDKAQRILYPAKLCALTIVPWSIILSQVVAGKSIIYIPAAGHCWFLFWLLILMWAYSTICEAEKPNNSLGQESIDITTSESVLKPFPLDQCFDTVSLFAVWSCMCLKSLVEKSVLPCRAVSGACLATFFVYSRYHGVSQ